MRDNYTLEEVMELARKNAQPVKPFFIPYEPNTFIFKQKDYTPDPQLTKFAQMLKEAVKKLEKEG